MLQILGEVVEEPILEAIRTSKAIGLEIDESTDISVTKQLDIHVRYTDKEGQLFCQILDLVSIPDGTARTIAEAVKQVIIKKEIPQDRIFGLGTDGAAVMTGKNGTAKLLTDTWPGLVSAHCAAHRLALACKDAAEEVPYMKTFRKHLQDMHLYFQNSANRTSALKAAASVLQVADLKVTEDKDTRQLSQEKAISNLQNNLPAVLVTLAEEADIKKDSVARRPDESGQPRDPTEVVCKICSCVIRAKDGQTTNLHDHLRVRHPAEYATLPARAGPSKKASQGQPTITGAFAKSTKYKTDSDRWRQLTDAVTRFLAKEMVLFNTVEKPSFKAMLHTFDKQYELPGRKYFSKTAIPNLFNEVRSSITKELGDLEYLALTTDMRSSCNMMPYMSVTVHYVNKEWTLQSKCLQTSFMPESHTADNLEEALREAINDWKLQEKQIACITTDNGANTVAAIRQLKWPWLSCLNLAINNSLATEGQHGPSFRGLPGSQHWLRRRELQKAQVELKLPEHSLITVIFKTVI
ncbi:unnamed protein product [Leuciscus chuanchicus]